MTDLTPALAAFVAAVEPTGITWMVVGSMATHLHGVDAIRPGDVDILVHPDTEDGPLQALAESLCSATPGAMPGGADPATFRSTAQQPLVHAGAWTFGRWFFREAKLEVARIREWPDAGLLETHGRLVWQHRRMVAWQDRTIPLVALEVQCATIAQRAQDDRIAAVTATTVGSWDDDLARRALLDRGLDPSEHACRPARSS